MQTELNELEMRVLAMLEEAGEETAVVALNTVVDPQGSPTELSGYQEVLMLLIKKGLIDVRMYSIPTGHLLLSQELGLKEVAGLGEHYRYLLNEGHWTDVRENGPPFFQTPLPSIFLTELGGEKSVEILESRGYQWWRPVIPASETSDKT